MWYTTGHIITTTGLYGCFLCCVHATRLLYVCLVPEIEIVRPRVERRIMVAGTMVTTLTLPTTALKSPNNGRSIYKLAYVFYTQNSESSKQG